MKKQLQLIIADLEYWLTYCHICKHLMDRT